MADDTTDIGITFLGTFFKASTLIDGGWRVSFDLDAKQATEIAKVSALHGSLLQFAIVPVKPESKRKETCR